VILWSRGRDSLESWPSTLDPRLPALSLMWWQNRTAGESKAWDENIEELGSPVHTTTKICFAVSTLCRGDWGGNSSGDDAGELGAGRRLGEMRLVRPERARDGRGLGEMRLARPERARAGCRLGEMRLERPESEGRPQVGREAPCEAGERGTTVRWGKRRLAAATTPGSPEPPAGWGRGARPPTRRRLVRSE
jgi:hypothetical protein